MYDSPMLPETQSVRKAARQLVRELQMLDTRYCIEGFTFSECHMLTELQAMGQATASELAERLVLEKSTISRLIEGLMKGGYLKVESDVADRRKKLLQLSAKGKAGVGRIDQYSNGQVESALSFVPPTERSELADKVDQYAKALRYSRLANRYEIRPIRKADNPNVARIIRDVMTEFGAVGQGYSINDPEVDEMYGAYPKPHSVFYVVTRDKEVLGCGGIGPLAGAEEGVCELRKMYLLPNLRGTGMGTKLLSLCLQEAENIGYKTCYLETLEHMSHARHLYRKYGFEPLDKPMGATGHSACDAWMAKSL
ncbi:MAG: putative acetyltransferase [Planctomycetaceae bacterium]|jgi:putative acetyltransferase